MKKIKQIFSYVLGATLVLGGVVFAGSLTPTNTPATSNFVTLSDVYNKLLDNEYSTSTHSVATTTDPTDTMSTLLDIWNAIPTIDAGTIATGTTIMGVRGTLSAGSPALEWSAYLESMTWDNAVTACTTWGGRLPTIGELLNAISQQFLQGGTEGPGGFAEFTSYWSGTEYDSDNAWLGGIGYGFISSSYNVKSDEFSVRCVR